MPESHSKKAEKDMDEFGQIKEAAMSSGFWAAGFALLGRLLKLRSDTGRPLIRWSLLWEIPTVIAMGYLGLAITEHMEWPRESFRSLALIMTLGYLGPEWLERALEKLLVLLQKK